jgi:hypothetical protein
MTLALAAIVRRIQVSPKSGFGHFEIYDNKEPQSGR